MSAESKVDINAHVREDDLELYAFHRLGRSELERVESHMRSCEFCQKRLTEVSRLTEQIGELSRRQNDPVGEERRSEARIPTDDPAIVRLVGPLIYARVVDASKSGIRLLLSERLNPGAQIQIQMKDIVALGEVRYCSPAGESYQAGIRLIDVVLPSSEV